MTVEAEPATVWVMNLARPLARLLVPDVAACAALLLAVPIADYAIGAVGSQDLFFHLASARHLLKHGAFPERDPFSVTATAPQFPHEWSFGLLAHGSVALFGARGPMLLLAALLALTFELLWCTLGRRGQRGFFEGMTFCAALAATMPTWVQPRPYHLGHVLFCVAWLLARAYREGDARAAWAFVPLTAAWVNLHGSWPLAPFLLGATTAGLFVSGELAAQRRARRILLHGASGALLAFAASAVSPGGVQTWSYPFAHVLLASTQLIQEWKPLDPGQPYGRALLALAATFTVLVARAPAPPFALLFSAGVLTLMALDVRRHAPFAAIALAASCAELWQTPTVRAVRVPAPLASALARIHRGTLRWDAVSGGALLVALAFSVLALRANARPLPLREGTSGYPIGLFDALRALPPGKVLNVFQWGGPISYFAGPDYKVFIDSRNDPYPQRVHEDYHRLLRGAPGWEAVIDRYDPQYLLWSHDETSSALLELLRLRGGWRELGREGDMVLWTRDRR